MIILTRLGGQQVAVNPDLIERAEACPDTVLTLVDGHKHIVVESVAEVIALIRSWRASVAAESYVLVRSAAAHPSLGAVAEPEPDDAPDSEARRLATVSQLDPAGARVLRMPNREA